MIVESHAIEQFRHRKDKGAQKARHDYGFPVEESLPARLTGVGVWLVAGFEAAHLIDKFCEHPSYLLPALILARMGIEVADAISAVVHVLLDKYLPVEWTNVQAFLRHHVTPELVVYKSYWSNLAEVSPYVFPIFALTSWASWNGYIHPTAAAGIWTAMLGGAHGTNFHVSGHMTGEKYDPEKPLHKQPPPLVYRILRKLLMALAPRHHNIHHLPGTAKNYAIITGNTNVIFEKFDLWHKLDLILWNRFGFVPHNWIQHPDEIPEHIRDQLKKDSEKIPAKLWQYSVSAFPDRQSDQELLGILRGLKAKWRENFIVRRLAYLTYEAGGDEEVFLRLYREDQATLSWIYGPEESSRGGSNR